MIWISGVSAIIAIVSAGIAFLSWLNARKSRLAAEKATGISSDLYEQGKVKFTIERVGRTNSYLLTNKGTHTAHDVTVSANTFTPTIHQGAPVELPSGVDIKIGAAIPTGPTDKQITVGYRNTPDGPRKTFPVHP